ncbi:MAG: hypothetical protein MZV64_73565 [Ignavibacteriales bacterium]|nr:hypothetical protein [Ignavibacteriales bacterium]
MTAPADREAFGERSRGRARSITASVAASSRCGLQEARSTCPTSGAWRRPLRSPRPAFRANPRGWRDGIDGRAHGRPPAPGRAGSSTRAVSQILHTWPAWPACAFLRARIVQNSSGAEERHGRDDDRRTPTTDRPTPYCDHGADGHVPRAVRDRVRRRRDREHEADAGAERRAEGRLDRADAGRPADGDGDGHDHARRRRVRRHLGRARPRSR